MKTILKTQLNHTELSSSKTGEKYSLSSVVSELLGSKQLFIHHDIIEPGRKSSGAHRHTVIEEVVYIIKGTATVVEGEQEATLSEGSLVLFDPQDKNTHYLVNRTEKNVETITFSMMSELDKAIF